MNDRFWKRVRLVSLTALAPLVLASVLVQGALANGGAPTASNAPLLNATMSHVQGKQLASGDCRFTSTLSLAPGQTAVQEDTIAVDEASCTALVVRGTPQTAPKESGDRSLSGWARPEEGTAGTSTGAGTPPGVLATHSAGYYKSWYEDPIGLVVNSVKNSVDWWWNGSIVYSASCGYQYTWLSASGWGLHENNFFCRYQNSQTEVRSSSYAHFKNGIFCAFIDTHTYYERNNAYGRYNGYLVGSVSARKSSGCTGLLSFHTQLRRTLN